MPDIRICKDCDRKNRVPVSHLSDTRICSACKTQLPPINEPLDVDLALFNELLQEAKVPVLVDFWAAWSGPCRMADPEIARAASDMAGNAIVVKVELSDIRNSPLNSMFARFPTSLSSMVAAL